MPCVAEVVNRSLKADCTDFTTYSTGIRKVDTLRRLVGGRPQVKRRFCHGQEAFVIVGILNFCPALLFVKRPPDNNSRNNDNSHTVGYLMTVGDQNKYIQIVT